MSQLVKVQVKVSYNGDTKDFDGPSEQPLQAVFQKALTAFGLRPADQSALGLFVGGTNEVNLGTKLGDLNLPEGAVLILQARRAGGGGSTPPFVIVVPNRIRWESEGFLRMCGDSGWECVVLWAVSRGPDASAGRVARVFHPQHGTSRYLYEVNAAELFQIGETLLREQLKLVAQVHTHPGSSFHSGRDDAGPAIHSPGFVSLVVPNFARDGLGAGRGIFGAEFVGAEVWRELTPAELETLVVFEN